MNKKSAVAFGPVMPGWGSWEWIGEGLCEELAKYYSTNVFDSGELTASDLVAVIKQAPSPEWLKEVARRAAVIYCPVDFYGSAAEIDADAAMLRKCARVVVHCERLRRCFEPYARVEYVDHHVKFVASRRENYQTDGFILWVGVRTNLPPLVEWVNRYPLPAKLIVLTNLERPDETPTAKDLGFSNGCNVIIENWSKELQLTRTAEARAAFDIKGSDFRARHKPPAKAIDFVASGLPLAMNADCSSAEHLQKLGFDLASPLDTDRWLSPEYWEETQRFGAALRELLSLERVGRRMKRIIDEVLSEK